MNKVQESAARSDTRQYPSDFQPQSSPSAKAGDDFQIDYRRNCMVPGATHVGGCTESCQLARNSYEARQVAARHAVRQSIARAAKDELVIELHDGDTYQQVIPWRVGQYQVTCLPVEGNEWLYFDLDDVYAAVTAARGTRIGVAPAVTR